MVAPLVGSNFMLKFSIKNNYWLECRNTLCIYGSCGAKVIITAHLSVPEHSVKCNYIFITEKVRQLKRVAII